MKPIKKSGRLIYCLTFHRFRLFS